MCHRWGGPGIGGPSSRDDPMKPPPKRLSDLKPPAPPMAVYAPPKPRVSRQKPGKVLSAAERAAFLAARPDLDAGSKK